jgi:hypothetical protein
MEAYSTALEEGRVPIKGRPAFGLRPGGWVNVALRDDVAAVVEFRSSRCGRFCVRVLHQWWGGVLTSPTRSRLAEPVVRIRYAFPRPPTPTTGIERAGQIGD